MFGRVGGVGESRAGEGIGVESEWSRGCKRREDRGGVG